jgi:hypothetical protein
MFILIKCISSPQYNIDENTVLCIQGQLNWLSDARADNALATHLTNDESQNMQDKQSIVSIELDEDDKAGFLPVDNPSRFPIFQQNRSKRRGQGRYTIKKSL